MKPDIPSSIRVEKLNKSYGSKCALNALSFEVAQGQVIGLLGPNGAGKSTLLRILSGLIPADSGKAIIHGIPLASDPQRAKAVIGYLAEDNPLPPELRVGEYLNYRAQLKNIRRKERKIRITEVMELCELSITSTNKMIGRLSKGFRQRVGLADCLLANPRVLILDEPTSGLDPHQILSIRSLITELRGRVTILLSSHVLSEIEGCCDQIFILSHGNLIATGTPATLQQEFGTQSNYTVTVSAPEGALRILIMQADPNAQIHSLSTASGFSTAHFSTMQAEELGEVLFQKIRQNQSWQIRELSRREPSLEELFFQATQSTWPKAAAEMIRA